MSYFLEDTKFSSMSDTVVVDYSGMNEAMFNAEVAWGAINESAMKTEYQAIKNEDTSMLQEGISDFFEKVKEWFKNMIISIGRVIMNIKNKIILKFDIYEKYCKKAIVLLRKAENKRDKFGKIKVRGYASLGRIDAFKGELKKGLESAKKEYDKKSQILAEYNKKYNDINSDLTKQINNMANNEVALSQALSQAISVCTNMKGSLDSIRTAMKGFESSIKTAKEGVKQADREDKEAVKEAKMEVTFLNRTSSMYLNLNMRVAAYNISYIKMVVSKTKGKDSDAEKQKDWDKAMKKKESYYGF